MALAAAATTNPGQTPQYGLAYDLSSGQWVDAAQFREFVRSVLPATQTAAKQAADQMQAQSLKAQELERAQNYQDHGLFKTRAELGVDKSGVGNQLMTGFTAGSGYVKNVLTDMTARPARAIPVVGGWLGALGVGQGPDTEDLYPKYSKAGGLLTEDEFKSFNANTQGMLYDHAKSHKNIETVAKTPGISQGLTGFNYAYQGLTAGVEMAPHPLEYGSMDRWAQAWREAHTESLGNALVNIALDPFYSDETLDRWKRDNPWYQMSSIGSEFVATWYADPVVIAGKGLGATARLTRKELPLNENGAYGRGLTQNLQREQVTVRNPITKAVVNAQANRMREGWKNIEDYALATSAPEFARNLPMFASRYRAVDGGAGAFALHWAYNNRMAANSLLNSERVRTSLGDVANEFDFALPDTLDVADLTQQLLLGDPKAYAMLTKLHEVSPDELAKIAPGSGTLLDSMEALTTKHATLQSEVDDLLDSAKQAGDPREASGFADWSHRWEVHTNLEKRQAQLAEVSDALHKYDGYSDWLNLLTVKSNPRVSRVAAPTRERWSEVRKRDVEEGEQRALFMDNQFGHAHSYYKMPRGLFLKKANVAELDMAAGVNSGISAIERSFDQLENYFGYVPEQGARDTAVSAYVKANTSYDRYKIMHDLEETHVVGAIATKFGLNTDTARALVHKIYDERNRTINGILTGQGQVYRSAPTIMQRLKGGEDASLQLVSRNEDTGTVTLHMLDGRHKQTFEVPEEALQPRVSPEDTTQTPNYYNSLDHRRLYYKIKHDHRLLEEIDAGIGKRSKAAMADLGELVGTRFNEFWKPVQLFRLGWPMRVLMDEGARATAIYGPMYWLTGPGAEAVYQSGRNTLPAVADFIMRKRKGPLGTRMLGPQSTVEKSLGMRPNQFTRDYETTHAVQLPQSMWDKINPDRLEKVRGHVGEFENWQRENNRYSAWMRADNQSQLLDHVITGGELSPAQERLLDFAMSKARQVPGNRPEPPVFRAAKSYYERTKNGKGQALTEGPQVFDHVNNREHKNGYVVPLPDFHHELQKRIPGSPSVIGADQGKALMAWYSQNMELLSRNGMRIVVDPSGHITVGRHFRSNEFKKARQYAEYVSEKHPDVEMWDIGNKRSYRVQDPDDRSPIAEATYRYFANESVKAPQPGKAPIEGEPETYHGTQMGLPSDLHPREAAPMASGRMIGDGLYTTVAPDLAEQYGPHLYTIRGSKSGKTYKVWDADQPITAAQRADLDEWLSHQHLGDAQQIYDVLNVLPDSYLTKQHPEGRTWANLYEELDAQIGRDGQALLHRYLEEKHNVGAITHLGGTAHGRPHQVYVWLRPEDLVVKPLYAPTGEYMSIPEWFDHPQSVENFLPENRIIRRKPVAPEAPAREPLALPEGPSTAEALDNFDLAVDSKEHWVMRKIHERHQMGTAHKKITSSDGKTTYVEGAFAGHKGELFRGLTASNGTLDVLSEGHGHGTSMFRRQSEGFRTYSPPEFTDKALHDPKSLDHKKAVLYFQRYADTVNDHLGNSPIMQRMIKGQSDEQIVDWLERTPEGQRVAAEVKPVDMPTGIWVDDHRFKLNYYVPSKKIQRLLGKGRVKPSDFRKNIADEDLPVIYGADFEVLDRRRGAGQFLSDVADKMWTGLGNIPIDNLSRHPFAKAAYDTKIRALIGRTNSKWLTEKMLKQYQDEAHTFALEQTRRHLYNLTETTNFNDALRFIAPFWGAQFEAIQKWLRIISDRPETVARFFAGQRAVYNNFAVVDQDGNPVKSGVRPGGMHGLGLYHPTDMVVAQIPEAIQKRFGLEGISSTRIPIGSANTVLQGDLPLLPSLGPLVTIPADQFMRKVSDTYGVEHEDDLLYRWFFPIGRPRSKSGFGQMLDQFSPGWVNRVRQSQSAEDNQSRINMEMLIGREMLYKARKEGKPDPTPEEIAKAADHLWHVRIISGLVQPFQVQYMPDHQYWIDAYHRYMKQYGSQAWDKFIDKYGEEAAIFATSSSNSIGVPPTSAGMEEWSKNKKMIAKYPGWASAIISPQAYMGDFSSDAYGQQFNINLGPGDTRTLRSGTSLQDRLINDPETQLGWREYRKLDAAIEAELSARGLTSIQQKEAADLVQIKRFGVSQIMQKYRPWAREYQLQSDQIYSEIEDLKEWVGDGAFDNRPDIKGVRLYLTVRQQVADALDAYAAQGGSRSLQAGENGALRDWFYNKVGQIVLDNPAFAEFYSRYLSQDTMTLGGGGF
jgi:hypothetical protein